jgi:hypothetical protein
VKDALVVASKESRPALNADKSKYMVMSRDQNVGRSHNMKSYNTCYHSVQNLLSSSLLFKNMKIEIHRNTISPVVLYGCETWALTLREEHRLSMFENRVLKRTV